MVSQRCRVRDVDMFGKSAEKFLTLIPSCCLPRSDDSQDSSGPSSLESNTDKVPPSLPRSIGRRRRTPSTTSYSPGDVYEARGIQSTFGQHHLSPGSFLDYLMNARQMVTSCYIACRSWSWLYDGENPPPEALCLPDSDVANGISHPEDVGAKSFHAALTQNVVNVSANFNTKETHFNTLSLKDSRKSDGLSRTSPANDNSLFSEVVLASHQEETSTLRPSGLLSSLDQNGAVGEGLTSSKCENGTFDVDHSSSQVSKLKFVPSMMTDYSLKDVKMKLQHLPFLQINLGSGQSSSPIDGFGSPNLGKHKLIL